MCIRDSDPLIVGVDVSGGGSAYNVIAFRRGNDARSIPRIRIAGELTRDRSVLVGKLAEILKDNRPAQKVAAMFIDMAFGSPIFERLRALGYRNVYETNFGLTHTPERRMANMRAYMWDRMKAVSYTHLDVYKRQRHWCGWWDKRRWKRLCSRWSDCAATPAGRYSRRKSQRASVRTSTMPLQLR